MAEAGPVGPGTSSGIREGVYLRGLVPAELARCDGAASFLQSGFWGSFKARFGWTARGFLADWEGAAGAAPLLVMRRPLGPGFSFAYVPWGPELPASFPAGGEGRALAELAGRLRPFLPGDTAFIRFDPPWYTEGAGTAAPALDKPLVRSRSDVQPPDTVLLDLSPAEAEILGGMKPKWRYNVKLGEKKGVSVRRADEAGLEAFYALYRETARRDRIAIHSAAYYEALFSHCRDHREGASRRDRPGPIPEIRLYLAEHGGEPIAGIITLFRGGEAVYLYGASADHKRNLMAPYALQWRAIRDARQTGCLSYDLFGIPPREDPAHPMAGLYRFKTGFGGRILHRPGSWDYPCRPLIAGLFRTAEGLRKTWRDRRKTEPRAAATDR